MEKDKKVTALYCRLSKDDGSAHESLSIRTQKAMLMEYATRNGFGNCQYYVDDGYSGTNSDRPAFQELLDDIRDGKVATVITKDQSRLGRNHIETGTYMEIFFPEHGVRYIAINDGYDSNEQSQMDIAPFRNIINEMYAKDTSRKIKSALRTRKKSGKYISSGAPFGYQKDPADHNHLVIDPNTAPVVEYTRSTSRSTSTLLRTSRGSDTSACKTVGHRTSIFKNNETARIGGCRPCACKIRLLTDFFRSLQEIKKKSTILQTKYSAFLVENTGIEPVTSCMPCKRSPS